LSCNLLRPEVHLDSNGIIGPSLNSGIIRPNIHNRPCTGPIPVTTPPEGKGSSYKSCPVSFITQNLETFPSQTHKPISHNHHPFPRLSASLDYHLLKYLRRKEREKDKEGEYFKPVTFQWQQLLNLDFQNSQNQNM